MKRRRYVLSLSMSIPILTTVSRITQTEQMDTAHSYDHSAVKSEGDVSSSARNGVATVNAANAIMSADAYEVAFDDWVSADAQK